MTRDFTTEKGVAQQTKDDTATVHVFTTLTITWISIFTVPVEADSLLGAGFQLYLKMIYMRCGVASPGIGCSAHPFAE